MLPTTPLLVAYGTRVAIQTTFFAAYKSMKRQNQNVPSYPTYQFNDYSDIYCPYA